MLIGHQRQLELLKNSFLCEKLSHGLLVYGEKQLGKKKAATELAKFILCENSDKPCGKCRSCQDVEKNAHPDFIFLNLDKEEISVSKIRELIWKLSLKPYKSFFKVAIIDDAHLMNSEAQNCFLKTLEEPKGESFLILITEYPDLLLPTILSRVQKVRFFPVGKKIMLEGLNKMGAPKDKAELFYSLSLGRPGKAIEFFLDEAKIKEQEKIISDFEKTSSADLAVKFKFAKSLADDLEKNANLKLSDVLEIWLSHLRSALISEAKENSGKSGVLLKIKNAISAIQSVNYLISSTNVNNKLALEILLMEL